MVVSCEEVWREVSNYLDDDVEPELRTAVQEHLRGCKHCTAVMEGTRNVLQLYADDRMLEVPLGFGRRLHRRLEGNIVGSRRTFLGWIIAAAATVLAIGGLEFAKSSVSRSSHQRSEQARAGNHVPPEMMVVVAEDGKLFHAPGCPFIHEKTKLRTIQAREAMKEGYTPCVRCLKQYLNAEIISPGTEGQIPDRGHWPFDA